MAGFCDRRERSKWEGDYGAVPMLSIRTELKRRVQSVRGSAWTSLIPPKPSSYFDGPRRRDSFSSC
jgi:hypothetical protein